MATRPPKIGRPLSVDELFEVKWMRLYEVAVDTLATHPDWLNDFNRKRRKALFKLLQKGY